MDSSPKNENYVIIYSSSTLVFFQICIHYFVQLNTKEDILKNVSKVGKLGLRPNILQNIFIITAK